MKKILKTGLVCFLLMCLCANGLVWAAPAQKDMAAETYETEETENMENTAEEETDTDQEESEEMTEEEPDRETETDEEEPKETDTVIPAGEGETDTEEPVVTEDQPGISPAPVSKGTETEAAKTKAAEKAVGWEETEGGLRYRTASEEYLCDTTEKIGKYYFMFDENGYVKTGWQTVNGQTRYLKMTGVPGVRGAMLLGWQSINGITYYFKKSGSKTGVMFEGFQSIGGRRFYFAPSGAAGEKGRMLTGWQTVNGQTYYLKKTGEKGVKGKALIGWQSIGGKKYYFLKTGTQSGKMLLGFQSIGGRKFFFKRTGEYGMRGVMFTGWQTIDGKKYYFKKSGANGLKGAMFVGWQTIASKQYYFDPDGVYVPGKKKITVAVDAGHQLHGNSSLEPIGPGASERKPKVSSGTYGQWSGLNEYELNLTVAKKLQKELENRGYEVYMIRTTHNVDISNSQRAKNAADAGADILVRIHANSDSSSSVSGALTIAPTNSNPYMTKTNITKSRELSKKVLDGFCSATGAKKRDIWYTDTMSGINWSTIPVTIVEMGFMSNRQDDLNMANASYQNKMVKGMADGIDDYF